MIWTTVSSWSCFCWLYRASPSLSGKNIISLILVLTIWWCPCVESSLVLLEEGVSMTSEFSWQNSISLYPASFCTPRPNLFCLFQVFLVSHSVVSDSFETPWIAAHQASLSITNSQSLPKLMSIVSVIPSNHLVFCRPLLLLPSILPSIRVFSNESALCISWPKYWSFSFSISPSNDNSGLLSFRMYWLDLFAGHGTLKSLLQHHSSKASVLRCSAFFIVQLSHPYMTTGKTIALTRQTFVGKVMYLLFNMLSRLVITFLPRTKCLLISWLQSPSAVILEPRKIKSATVSTVSTSVCHEMMGLDAMILVFWMLSFKTNFFTLLFHFHQEAL